MKKIIVVLTAVFAFMSIHAQQTYIDKPFTQDYADKFQLASDSFQLFQARTDRNQVVKIISTKGLLQPFEKTIKYE